MSELTPDSFSTQVVPLPRVVNFVRHVSHDVRNGLNAIDLQAAYVAEICGGGEVGEEMAKLRKIVGHVTQDMQELSGRFGELRPIFMECPIDEIIQGLKREVGEEFENQAKRVVWEVRNGEESLEMDYNLLLAGLRELIRNAIFFREGDAAIHFTVGVAEGRAEFEVRQVRSMPAGQPAHWGCEPLNSSRRGGYGLGLFYVRRVLDTLGGEFAPVYDQASGELSVRLSLPLKRPAGGNP